MLNSKRFLLSVLLVTAVAESGRAETDELLEGFKKVAPAENSEIVDPPANPAVSPKIAAPVQKAPEAKKPEPEVKAVVAPQPPRAVKMEVSKPIPAKEVAEESAPSDPFVTIGLLGGYGFDSYALTSSGFSITTAYNGGPRFGVEIRSKLSSESDKKIFLRAQRGTTETTGLSGLSPSSITVERTEVQAALALPLGSEGVYSLLVGYGYRSRSAPRTATRIAVSDTSEHGPLIGLLGYYQLSALWKIETELSFVFPASFTENSLSTGAPESALHSLLGVQVLRRLDSSKQFGFGVGIQNTSRKFTGAGARGTSGAGESDYSIRTQLELRFDI